MLHVLAIHKKPVISLDFVNLQQVQLTINFTRLFTKNVICSHTLLYMSTTRIFLNTNTNVPISCIQGC